MRSKTFIGRTMYSFIQLASTRRREYDDALVLSSLLIVKSLKRNKTKEKRKKWYKEWLLKRDHSPMSN